MLEFTLYRLIKTQIASQIVPDFLPPCTPPGPEQEVIKGWEEGGGVNHKGGRPEFFLYIKVQMQTHFLKREGKS